MLQKKDPLKDQHVEQAMRWSNKIQSAPSVAAVKREHILGKALLKKKNEVNRQQQKVWDVMGKIVITVDDD